jgi:Cu+-exporting ATPase
VVEARVGARVVARFHVSDEVKSDARVIVDRLRSIGTTPMIVSGDAEGAVRRVADAVGIDRTHSAVLPDDKLRIVHELQASGAIVAMVGDGVNDAAALVAADLGIAMGTGTDAAMEAGDLTIVDGDLAKVPRALAISRRTLRIIRTNLFWAFAYNVAALPECVRGVEQSATSALTVSISRARRSADARRLRAERALIPSSSAISDELTSCITVRSITMSLVDRPSRCRSSSRASTSPTEATGSSPPCARVY